MEPPTQSETQYTTDVQTFATTNKEMYSLVVEDVSCAAEFLAKHNIHVTRITHRELMSATGDQQTGKLKSGTYDLLWITTPHDYAVRVEATKP